MKRIEAACICQTLHFKLKDDVGHDEAVALVQQEVEQYQRWLERSRTQYRIVEQTTQPDGSIVLKVIKQYNSAPVGDYLA
jgi:protein subunit release factor A